MARTGSAIEKLRRRGAENRPLNRADLEWRIQTLDGASFDDDPELLELFRDVFEATCAPPGLDFVPRREDCSISSHGVEFSGRLRFSSGSRAEVGTITRRIRIAEDTAHHRTLRIEPQFRGFGLAAIILEHSMGYYLRLGLKEVVLYAALTTGPYYWAKMGFDFNDGIDGATSEEVRTWCQRINNNLGLNIDCTYRRTPEEWSSLGRDDNLTCTLEDIASAMPKDLESDKIKTLAIEIGITHDQPIHFGKAALLTGPRWDAIAKVSDPYRSRLLTYIGARSDRTVKAAQESAATEAADPDRRGST